MTWCSAAETVRSDWVVGCDGAHSRVRTAAGIGFPGVPLVERFLLADVRADLGLCRHTVAVWLQGDDLLGAFPLPGPNLWRLMAPASGAADVAPDAVLNVLTGLLTRHTGTTYAVRACDWTSPSASTGGSRRPTAVVVSCSPATPRTSTARSADRA